MSNKLDEIIPKLSDKVLPFYKTKKESTVLDRLHVGHSYFAHSFILKKETSPVCVAFNTIIITKHILIDISDLVEVVQKYFEERSLYSLFRKVNPEKIVDYLEEIGMFCRV